MMSISVRIKIKTVEGIGKLWWGRGVAVLFRQVKGGSFVKWS